MNEPDAEDGGESGTKQAEEKKEPENKWDFSLLDQIVNNII